MEFRNGLAEEVQNVSIENLENNGDQSGEHVPDIAEEAQNIAREGKLTFSRQESFFA